MPVPVMKTATAGGRSAWSMSVGKHVCSVLLQAFIAVPCLSQTIGNWAFSNTTSGTGGTYNTVSVADFSAAIPTKAYNGGTVYYGEGGWPAGALDPSAYLEFTISPNTGYQLDLSNIVLTMRRSTTGTAAGSGPTSWSLRSSRDGYAADLSSNSLTTGMQNFTVTLGSSFLQLYTPVTFRLYGYNAVVTTGGLSRVVVDNISIQGIGSTLPLTFTGVQALRKNDKMVSLKWQMVNVGEGNVFNVERSLNGTDFTTINRFTQQDDQLTASFQYEDNQAPGNVPAIYYRIKINEPSGWTYFSWLVKVNNATPKQLVINYANATSQSLVTSLQVPEKGSYQLSVVTMNGALLQQRSLELETGVQVFTLPLQTLSHGTYVVRLVGKEGQSSKKFVY
ncbi:MULTISPECIES: T9SS type A sorting domain-containing protein [Niastella]|uniref:T9SS type A sorting domain-containing protein n=1 Tax=Niastella soli TaxID=2821487 RepID=A0ABS3Z076_9BACT|nr:T9SS type A sorting domain-containing protein [Niastella soli]MBO9203570.1 T9SS type A sorting domain-containing protein [Niastella soli]